MRKTNVSLNAQLHGVEVTGVTKDSKIAAALESYGLKADRLGEKYIISPKRLDKDAYAAAFKNTCKLLKFNDISEEEFAAHLEAAYAPKEEKPKAAKQPKAKRERKDWDVEYLYKQALYRLMKADRDQLLAILEATDALFATEGSGK